MKQLYIVGTGPGDPGLLSPAARAAIAASTELVAYPLYIDLLGGLAAGKTRHDRPLGEEIERARLALELAAAGRVTALLSSGDAGIYAMATLVFELLDREPKPDWQEVAIQVIPGISAIQATAARVGAPIAHDFCTISLSDLLTPWETIETRIRAAGLGDFVVAFYNPVSQKRHWQLARARDILLAHRPADTPVVIARNVSRVTERIGLTTLGALDPAEVDMLTLVLVGNRETRRVGDWVYTPRGYGRKLAPDLTRN
ncbi:MAG TPA: precorrin-3B C(17)-methyltransferase [Candidatus Competibacteraceae bacterium]|nr:precorrin-3B C(17)-methyltransferase [Candidatus Competibacteraceae bacterium]